MRIQIEAKQWDQAVEPACIDVPTFLFECQTQFADIRCSFVVTQEPPQLHLF